MTTALVCGYIQTMTQNTVYALPGVRALLFCDESSPTITMSNTVGFTASKSLTLTNGQAEVAGGFVKCTTGDVTVSLKKF